MMLLRDNVMSVVFQVSMKSGKNAKYEMKHFFVCIIFTTFKLIPFNIITFSKQRLFLK